MSSGLSVSDVVNVQIQLSPIAAAVRNFGSLLIVGSSAIIDVVERIRKYTTLAAVAADFGTSAPEYLAANLFFSQSPTPAQLYIGAWAYAATAGLLHGGPLSSSQQLASTWTGITNGSTKLTIDGTLRTLSGLNFSAVTNMNGVASVINTALGANGTCTWDSVYSRLEIVGTGTGVGTHASGTVTLTGNPANNDTLTIQGTAITFVTGSPSGSQVQIGASAAATGAALLAFLQASVDANLVKMTYALDSTQTILTVTAVTLVAATGNAYTLVKSSANITLSGATLSGGVNAGSMTFAQATGSGTDITVQAKLDQADGASIVQGISAESLLTAVTTLAGMSNDWYGLNDASTHVQDSDRLAVAAFIEAATPSRIYGTTTQDANVLSASATSDIAYQLKALNYTRTFTQYSSSSPYAAASIFGRAFTVDFTGSNTTITLKFKTEPGVTAETLTETQASAAAGKNCNVFVNYDNSTAIIQEGVMAAGYFFDEIHGTDWLQNNVQTAVYNLLRTSPTKIPQTDSGVNTIATIVAQAVEQGVTNGLLAPGTWTGPDIGALKTGQTLAQGYYVFAPPVASQSQAARAARIAPTIQVAAKLAGAVHFANVVINVNR